MNDSLTKKSVTSTSKKPQIQKAADPTPMKAPLDPMIQEMKTRTQNLLLSDLVDDNLVGKIGMQFIQSMGWRTTYREVTCEETDEFGRQIMKTIFPDLSKTKTKTGSMSSRYNTLLTGVVSSCMDGPDEWRFAAMLIKLAASEIVDSNLLDLGQTS